jgi:hypothetical protein
LFFTHSETDQRDKSIVSITNNKQQQVEMASISIGQNALHHFEVESGASKKGKNVKSKASTEPETLSTAVKIPSALIKGMEVDLFTNVSNQYCQQRGTI